MASYSVHRDPLTIILSIVISVLILFGSGSLVLKWTDTSDWWTLFTAGVLFLALAYSALITPTKLELTKKDLIIHRVGLNKAIQIDQIQSLVPDADDKVSGAIRLFGVGGLFGYYGLFYNNKMGRMHFHATSSKNRILIKMKSGKKYVITPGESDLSTELGKRINA